jgi:hypothetical protein
LDDPARFKFKKWSLSLNFVAGILPATLTLFRGSFTVQHLGDTYIHVAVSHLNFGSLSGAFANGVQVPEPTGLYGGGSVWVNGHNLGRWDSEGPQQSLYCPASFLKVGTNEIYVLNHATSCYGVAVTSYVAPAFGPAGTLEPESTGQGV